MLTNDNVSNSPHRIDRLDRLKGPRNTRSESTNEHIEASGMQREELPLHLGPPQANEEWRRLYASIKRATERLRD
ncbi:hypothetical protein ACX1C1_15370 [Paenibacillus sp. strain BS8-2]